ncbi:MAG: hypothetical protein FJ276_30280 [Planctomycetes bacterium]|nr:hypothetical protein [Planctomycetota bacterium]
MDGTVLAKSPFSETECELPATTSLGTDELRERFGKLDDELIAAGKEVGKTYLAMAMFVLPGPEDLAFWALAESRLGLRWVCGKLFKGAEELTGKARNKALDELENLNTQLKGPKDTDPKIDGSRKTQDRVKHDLDRGADEDVLDHHLWNEETMRKSKTRRHRQDRRFGHGEDL